MAGSLKGEFPDDWMYSMCLEHGEGSDVCLPIGLLFKTNQRILVLILRQLLTVQQKVKKISRENLEKILCSIGHAKELSISDGLILESLSAIAPALAFPSTVTGLASYLVSCGL